MPDPEEAGRLPHSTKGDPPDRTNIAATVTAHVPVNRIRVTFTGPESNASYALTPEQGLALFHQIASALLEVTPNTMLRRPM